MKITHYLFPVTLLAAGAFAACGGAKPMTESPPPPPPPAESATPPAESATPPAESATPPAESAAAAASAAPEMGPPKPWKDMSMDEKKAYMKKAVVPHMKPLFIAQDAKRYSDFGCDTCHGKGAKEKGKFKMPNPGLPKLDFKHKLAKEKKKHPEMMDFMAHKVLPDMVKLLGVKPFDPKTMTGFGCTGCHTPKGGMGHHGKK